MRGFMHRSFALALTLALSALATLPLGGCAVQTASGDPSSTATEEGTPRSESSGSTAQPGQATGTPSETTPTTPYVAPARQPLANSPKASTDPDPVVKPQSCAGTSPCGSSQDNTEPLPWISSH